jgi:hypothetical protein
VPGPGLENRLASAGNLTEASPDYPIFNPEESRMLEPQNVACGITEKNAKARRIMQGVKYLRELAQTRPYGPDTDAVCP